VPRIRALAALTFACFVARLEAKAEAQLHDATLSQAANQASLGWKRFQRGAQGQTARLPLLPEQTFEPVEGREPM
jgi:hypothetical protein